MTGGIQLQPEPEGPRVGRIPRLEQDPDLGKNICGRVALGVPLGYAAEAFGASASQASTWLSMARNYRNGGDWVKPCYVEFLELYEKAFADSVAQRVARISKAANEGAWQADAWWLARMASNEFGDRIAVQAEATVAVTNPQLEEASIVNQLVDALAALTAGSAEAAEPSRPIETTGRLVTPGPDELAGPGEHPDDDGLAVRRVGPVV